MTKQDAIKLTLSPRNFSSRTFFLLTPELHCAGEGPWAGTGCKQNSHFNAKKLYQAKKEEAFFECLPLHTLSPPFQSVSVIRRLS
jgi:hypothetical protein